MCESARVRVRVSESHSRRSDPLLFSSCLFCYTLCHLASLYIALVLPDPRARQRSGATLISARSSLKAAAETCVRSLVCTAIARRSSTQSSAEPLPLRHLVSRVLVCSFARALVPTARKISHVPPRRRSAAGAAAGGGAERFRSRASPQAACAVTYSEAGRAAAVSLPSSLRVPAGVTTRAPRARSTFRFILIRLLHTSLSNEFLNRSLKSKLKRIRIHAYSGFRRRRSLIVSYLLKSTHIDQSRTKFLRTWSLSDVFELEL